MIALRLKKEELVPGLVILAGAIMALIYRFDLHYLKVLALVSFLFIFMKGFSKPWLLLLAAIPALFALEPAPTSLSIPVFMIILFLFSYTCGTYLYELRTRSIPLTKLLVRYHLIFFLILGLSFSIATSKDVFFSDWLRAITPFLILYLVIPLSLTFKEQFELKTKWIFIAYIVLTYLIVIYTNIVFFTEDFFRVYWLDPQGIKIFKFTDNLDASLLTGPFKDRVTMRVALATSELLPVCLTALFVIAILGRNKKNRILAVILSLGPLFTILETYTRSMLMSSLLVIGFVSLFTLIFIRPPIRYYINYAVIVIFATLIFTIQFNLSSIWFGRVNAFIQTLPSVNHQKLKQEEVQPLQDENLLVRVDEYKKAFKIFSENPVEGGGMGVKHDMAFKTSENQYLRQKVGYVHNWIMYWLMVSGIFGLVLYSCFLFMPLYYLLKMNSKYNYIKIISISIIFTMSLYGLFFAVFRLISFNLILAIIGGMGLCICQSQKKTIKAFDVPVLIAEKA